ncbi:MAG: MTH1187 family thiamine-binding protein [Desulfovibrionaceae bacterium]
MSVIVDLSIFPVGKGESLAGPVARAVGIIQASGLDHVFGPMGTAIEGEWDEVMAVVDRCREALHEDAERVYMTLKVDSRQGRKGGLTAKAEAVRRRLGG